MADNHGIVYELFLIVDLTSYCINSDRNVVIQNDSDLYVQYNSTIATSPSGALGSGTAQSVDDFLC